MKYRPGAVLHVVPALLYVVVVFYFGSIRLDPLQAISFDLKDKVLHALAFGGMAIMHARALAYVFPEWTRGRAALWGALLASSFGGLLELWQAALPYRSADPYDFLADSVGAALAALAFWRLGDDRAKAASR